MSENSGRVWSNGGVLSNYRRLRAFFNFMSHKVEGFPNGLLNRMNFAKPIVDRVVFKPQEMELIKSFVADKKDSQKWGWFIRMLVLMLETGVRISELCKMKINDVEPHSMTWSFRGKGSKLRTVRIPEYVWFMISHLIVDERGLLRTDKEYVFHSRYWKPYNTKKFPLQRVLIEDLHSHFTTDGFRNKFYDFKKELKLNPKVSPHTCRRHFITEMLKNTNGDIPLVAELVGHSSWDMVKLYANSLITTKTQTNLGLFQSQMKKVG